MIADDLQVAAKAAEVLGSGVLGYLLLRLVLPYVRPAEPPPTAKLAAGENGAAGEATVSSWVIRIDAIVAKQLQGLVVPIQSEIWRVLQGDSLRLAEMQQVQTAILQRLDRLEQLITQRHERGIQERAEQKAHLEDVRVDIKRQLDARTSTFEAIRSILADVKGMCVRLLDHAKR